MAPIRPSIMSEGATTFCTCRCVRQRLLHEHFTGDVIQYIAVVVNDAVLSMRRERVQRNVGDEPQFWYRIFQGAHCPLHKSIRIESLVCSRTF